MQRLGTDYIDLYEIHEFDKNTPLEVSLQALDDLVRGKGKSASMWAAVISQAGN